MQDSFGDFHKRIAGEKVDLPGELLMHGRYRGNLVHWRLLARALRQNSDVAGLIPSQLRRRIQPIPVTLDGDLLRLALAAHIPLKSRIGGMVNGCGTAATSSCCF